MVYVSLTKYAWLARVSVCEVRGQCMWTYHIHSGDSSLSASYPPLYGGILCSCYFRGARGPL